MSSVPKMDFQTPLTVEELAPHLPAVALLSQWVPWVEDLQALTEERLGEFTFVYINGRVFGAFYCSKNKHSAEVGAVFRQDLRDYNKKAYRVYSRAVIQAVLTYLFKVVRVNKIICKPRKGVVSARMFAVLNGFKKINTEKDADVYKLTYKDWAKN